MNEHSWPPATLLDYAAAQSYLGGVSRSMIKTLVGHGELRVVNIGRRAFFRRENLDAYIERQTAKQ